MPYPRTTRTDGPVHAAAAAAAPAVVPFSAPTTLTPTPASLGRLWAGPPPQALPQACSSVVTASASPTHATEPLPQPTWLTRGVRGHPQGLTLTITGCSRCWTLITRTTFVERWTSLGPSAECADSAAGHRAGVSGFINCVADRTHTVRTALTDALLAALSLLHGSPVFQKNVLLRLQNLGQGLGVSPCRLAALCRHLFLS